MRIHSRATRDVPIVAARGSIDRACYFSFSNAEMAYARQRRSGSERHLGRSYCRSVAEKITELNKSELRSEQFNVHPIEARDGSRFGTSRAGVPGKPPDREETRGKEAAEKAPARSRLLAARQRRASGSARVRAGIPFRNEDAGAPVCRLERREVCYYKMGYAARERRESGSTTGENGEP